MSTLYELTSQFQELLDLIQQGEFDSDMLQDTLEGLTGEIEIKADGYAKVIKELEGDIAKIKFEISRLTNKKTSLEASVKSLRTSLETAMRTTGKTKFKTDLFSFGIQKNGGSRSLTILKDIDKIPKEYIITPPPIPNNEAIRELLKNKDVDWAKLEPQSESLRIR